MFSMDVSFDGNTFEAGDLDFALCDVAQRFFVVAKPFS
jgi:hypothetical protein